MKVEPKAGPSLSSANNNESAKLSASAQDARARAIARLTGGPQAAQAQANGTQPGVDIVQTINSQENVQTPVTTEQTQTSTERVDIAETQATEAKPQEVTAPTPKVDEALSAQYAQLARKEKALRSQAQELSRQKAQAQADLQAQRDAIKAEVEAAYKQGYISKEEFLADPQSVISKFGQTAYDQFAQSLLNPTQPQDPATLRTIKALELKVAELEGKQDKSAKSYEEQQANNYKQAVEQIRRDASQLVKTDPDYETIKETGSVNDVVTLIERTFKEGLGEEYPAGTLLTIEQAAAFVEEELLEEAVKIAKIAKVQKRLSPTTSPAQKQQPSNPQQTQQMKTLTNNVGAAKPMTARERAIAAFHGQSKQS